MSRLAIGLTVVTCLCLLISGPDHRATAEEDTTTRAAKQLEGTVEKSLQRKHDSEWESVSVCDPEATFVSWLDFRRITYDGQELDIQKKSITGENGLRYYEDEWGTVALGSTTEMWAIN